MIMGNNKTRSGLSLKKRLFRVSKWIAGRTRSPSRGYSRLGASSPGPCAISPMSKILSWCRCLTSKRTKSLCSSKPGSGDVLVARDPVGERPTGTMKVPKGHLAVYVGRRSGELRRVLVPVVYFNHPLFGDLLREAKDEFGFSHRGGGITIPCEVSEFERVKSRVAAAAGYCGRWRRAWKKHLMRKV